MSENKSTAKISYLIIGIVALVFALLAAAGLNKIKAKLSQAKAMEAPALAVKTVKVQRGVVERTLPALATVKSAATIQIKAEIGGKILTLAVREGDFVKIGQIIAIIDSREQDAQLQAAEARTDSASSQVAAMNGSLQALISQLDSLKINLNFWAGELKRDDELYKAGAIAQSGFENTRNRKAEAESKFAGLQSQIQAQKSQIDALLSQKKATEKDVLVWKVRRDYAEITAPVDGVISARLQEEGNRVMPGTAILNIEDTAKTRLLMQIPQESAAKISAGQQVRMQGRDEVDITVSRVFPVQNELRQVIVEAETKDPVSGLFYDMQIPVRIVVESAEGSVISEQARFVDFQNFDKFFVYVIKEGWAQRTSVSSVLTGDKGVSLVRSDVLPENTELAVGAYLENIRLPASFAVEVIK